MMSLPARAVTTLLFAFTCAVAAFPANNQAYELALDKRQQEPNNSSSLNVDLGYSVYQGTLNSTTSVRTWLGIRYAKPPTGSLRWQAPEAPSTNRTAVVQANVRTPQCPQSWLAAPPYRGTLSTEDCLYLDVYSPANANGLPVMVYIHGGGYAFGRSSNSNLNFLLGTNNNSFVGVVIQYRLGAFGFLASDEVGKLGVNNAGLLDQQFALLWVKQYISRFGGNASQVTIAGESAGGGSVVLQATSYGGTLGDSLFANAITSSAYLPSQHRCDAWVPSQSYYAFASRAGCFPASAYGGTNESIFQCLQRQDSVVLQYASFNVSSSGRFASFAFVPCIDGSFIQQDPGTLLSQKKVNGRHALVGHNADDGAPFVNPNMSTIADLVSWLQLSYPLFKNDDIAKVLSLYPNDNSSYPATQYGWATSGTALPSANNISSFAVGQKQRAMNIYAESNIICPSCWFSEAFTSDVSTAYSYQYSLPAAEHAADLYALLSFGRPYQSPDFVTAIRSIWGNFITTANPSISNLIANGASSSKGTAANPASNWPKYNSPAPRMINLNSTGGTSTVVAGLLSWAPGNATVSVGPGLVNDFTLADMNTWEAGRGARCEFWRSMRAVTPA